MEKNDLTKEQRLLILLSRITFKNEVIDEITCLVDKGINWYEFFSIAIINKVSLLVWYNLNKFQLIKPIPKQLERVIQFYYIGNKKRNTIYLQERDILLQVFRENNICCLPLKGAFLLGNLYSDIGIRQVNDMDFMVKKEDSELINSTMVNIGYCQDDFDEATQAFKAPSRKQSLLWKMNMNNLYPYKKISDSEYAKIIEFDFSFSLDLELKTNIVNSMIDRARLDKKDGLKKLIPSDFFLHLCSHLYKEAINVMWVTLGKDINLIKFCDVREFILKFMNADILKEVVITAKKEGLEEAVYYTIFYLNEIYGDGYESELLKILSVKNTSFLNQFGKKDYDNAINWEKSFWERLFSSSNIDELPDTPKYISVEEK